MGRAKEVARRVRLAAATAGVARPTVWSLDGSAVHAATADLGLDGNVSKWLDSRYLTISDEPFSFEGEAEG